MKAVQLPYQAVMQPVRILSVVHLYKLQSILGTMLSLVEEEEELLSSCLYDDVGVVSPGLVLLM